MNAYKQRISDLFSLVYDEKNSKINIDQMRGFCFENGIPDDNKHIRSIIWKVLLNYLPANREEWPSSLKTKRNIYREFVSDLIVNDNKLTSSHDDHPLNPDPNSNWKNYFRENEILQQIDKDVRRLYPDMSFFQQKITKVFGSTNCDIVARVKNTAQSVDVVKDCFGFTQVRKNKHFLDNYADESTVTNGEASGDVDDDEFHWQVVARILFIYAKLNPGQGYVQGMNEIIGPIYYVFANDPKEDWLDNAEADTFWCFTNLMSEIRDIFNKHADADRSSGIVSLMEECTKILSKVDYELYQRVNLIQSIKPHYYAFRWITLLLSQEFSLPEILRLWDYLFSDEHRFQFLLKLCCSMILTIRSDLMAGDFASNMKLLQNFPESIDINLIVNRAKAIKYSRTVSN